MRFTGWMVFEESVVWFPLREWTSTFTYGLGASDSLLGIGVVLRRKGTDHLPPSWILEIQEKDRRYDRGGLYRIEPAGEGWT